MACFTFVAQYKLTSAAFFHCYWIFCLHSFCQSFSWVHLVLKKGFFLSPSIVQWWKCCLKFFSSLPVFLLKFSSLLCILSSPRLCLPVSGLLLLLCWASWWVGTTPPSRVGRVNFQRLEKSRTCSAATLPFKRAGEWFCAFWMCVSYDPVFYPHLIWQFNNKPSCKSYADNNYYWREAKWSFSKYCITTQTLKNCIYSCLGEH